MYFAAFLEPTNIYSTFFGISCEKELLNYSGPTPDSSPTLNIILKLLAFLLFIKVFNLMF